MSTRTDPEENSHCPQNRSHPSTLNVECGDEEEQNLFYEWIMLLFGGYYLLRNWTDNWFDGLKEEKNRTVTRMDCSDDYAKRCNAVIMLNTLLKTTGMTKMSKHGQRWQYVFCLCVF
ncbi:hypothetical protein V1477_021342 [Vespula maculifrons]|uniref:Uncharacterized protein n=1 Tax=Vespula maculifrons TaxID=7453 RepID=A0ABD2AGV2_VESMC